VHRTLGFKNTLKRLKGEGKRRDLYGLNNLMREAAEAESKGGKSTKTEVGL